MIVGNIRHFLTIKQLSTSKAEKLIGLSNGTLSKPFKHNKSITTDTLEKFLLFFSDINPVWLLTGVGNELLSSKTEIKPRNNNEDLTNLQLLLKEKDKRIQEKDEMIALLKTALYGGNKMEDTTSSKAS